MALALRAKFSSYLFLQGWKCSSLPFLEESREIVWAGHLPSLLPCVGHCVVKNKEERKAEGI